MIALLLVLNDGNLTQGGSPELLSGHASVRMRSERVDHWVTPSRVKARCDFVFVNDGPACTARVGFPDSDENAYTDHQEDKAPIASLDKFRLWIQGKPVPTALQRNPDTNETWHVKTVRFPAHSSVRVSDEYEHPVYSSALLYMNYLDPGVSDAGYVVHTGSSWKGNIGRSEFRFHFALPGVKKLRAVPYSQVLVSGGVVNDEKVGQIIPADTIVFEGPGTPTVKGTTLTWVRENWRPASTDDFRLSFNFVKKRKV